MRTLLIASLLCLASTAQAVPLLIEQQGRLLDSADQPITGTQTVDFSLWDSAVSGNLLWTETHELIFDNGYFSAILGAENFIDDIFLATDVVFLGLTVEGEVLSPRQRVVSAPYAIVAGTAQNVAGGVVDATSISVGGNPIVDSSGEWVGTPPPDTLSGLTCDIGDVPQKSAGGWVCVAGTSLGTTITEAQVDTMVANNGYALAANLADADVATTPISWNDISNRPTGLNDGDDDTLANMTCADGQSVTYDTSISAWDCSNPPSFDLELVQVEDPRLTYVPETADCNSGNWCAAANNWSANRFSTNSRYTYCSGDADCSSNTVTLALDSNVYRTVLLSHLDWSSSRFLDVYLSFDGGASYAFHKRVQTQRHDAATPYTSKIRAVASNLPLGNDVRVRLVASRGRMQFEGLALAPFTMAEEDSHPSNTQVFRYRTEDGGEWNSWTALIYTAFTFQKLSGSSRLKITWTDSYRTIAPSGSGVCAWELRLNGVSCSPAPIYHMQHNTYASGNSDTHQSSTVAQVCEGVPAGDVALLVYSRRRGTTEDCYRGYEGGVFTADYPASIIVEEIF